MLNPFMRLLFICGAAVLGAALAPPATASSFFGIAIRDVSITNQYSYAFGQTRVPSTVGGERSTFLESDRRPGPTSQLGVDFVGQADAESFYFLHNDYCVGQCQITSSTTIRFTIENVFGEDLESVRFDSLITPGHLALVGLGSYEDTAASFGFSVSRTDLLDFVGEGETNELYSASGYADIFGLRVEANGLPDPFNATRQGTNEGQGFYYDWSATPLELELGTLEAGQTIYVDYTATYMVKSFNTCTDILNCNAAQVVFGDPRNIGGGSELSAQSFARTASTGDAAEQEAGTDPQIDGGTHAVITREYEASYIPYAFTFGGAEPSFEAPTPNAPIRYVGNYIVSDRDTGTISGVPEPATWATMMIGFAVVGGALRRRRAGAGAAAA